MGFWLEVCGPHEGSTVTRWLALPPHSKQAVTDNRWMVHTSLRDFQVWLYDIKYHFESLMCL